MKVMDDRGSKRAELYLSREKKAESYLSREEKKRRNTHNQWDRRKAEPLKLFV
jgi:hypothetical protein